MSARSSNSATTDRGFGPVVEFASRVLAPAGALTAVLYYFGYARERALFAYFGVDLASLDFSTTDYLVRSTGTVFLPLATLLLAAVVAVAMHYLLLYLLSQVSFRWRRATWIALAGIAALMLLLGAVGLHRRHVQFLDPLAASVALGAGAILFEYAIDSARNVETVPAPLKAALDGTEAVRRLLAAALVLVAIFWATANLAEQRGIAAAQAIELTLPAQSQAVVYSRVRLQISGPGVNVESLGTPQAAFTVRYNGLRLLVHSGGRWFLLPVGWTRENGATVILLPDSSSDIRVDLAP